MRVTVLGTGSKGNATLVESGTTRILIDAGFSGRDLERRLHGIGLRADTLAAILITHEHGDHTRGMGVLARRFDVPLYISERTHSVCARLLNGSERVVAYTGTMPFSIGTLQVCPFLTVHDAADPIAVAVMDTDSGIKLGIATDLGRPTAGVRAALGGCDLLVLEANHDDVMLWNGPYPWSVKQRIASSHGHLSNGAAAELARELNHPGLGGIVLAHLSEHCNHGGLALDTVGGALARAGYAGPLWVGRPDEALEPIDVTALRRRTEPAQLRLML
ncbi:MAG: MBL fold metallo-hydrolase [Longimicrobiales bacterium]